MTANDVTQPTTTPQNPKSVQDVSKHVGPGRIRGKREKTHADYWKQRLFKNSFTRGGVSVECGGLSVKIQHRSTRETFSLQSANREMAAREAKEIYTFVLANGMAAAIEKFKRPSDASPRLNLTIGEYFTAVKETGKLSVRTFLNYQNCLRTIVSRVFGVKDSAEKFDYKSGGNQKWIERIDRTRLERLTPERVSKWQRAFVSQAGNSPAAIASAKRTANSYVRCARSLFSKDILKRLKGIQLPSTLPFEGVELFESGSVKYVSKLNVQTLIAAAQSELRSSEPEVYKAFLLGLFAGMRRAEIDLAEWLMIDWNKGVLRLEQTEWLRLKTHDSAGELYLEPQTLIELKNLMRITSGPFIIASSRPPRNDSARPYYRCEPILDRLTEWLRSKGITANKPLHELRKELGAQIATQHGIYAASRFLRHSDITTTSRHYAEHKAHISVGFGKLLSAEEKQSKPLQDENAE